MAKYPNLMGGPHTFGYIVYLVPCLKTSVCQFLERRCLLLSFGTRHSYSSSYVFFTILSTFPKKKCILYCGGGHIHSCLQDRCNTPIPPILSTPFLLLHTSNIISFRVFFHGLGCNDQTPLSFKTMNKYSTVCTVSENLYTHTYTHTHTPVL